MKILNQNELSELSIRQLWKYMNKLSVHCMYGMVVEDNHTEIDGVPVTVSKIKRFNRKAKMSVFNKKAQKSTTVADLSIIRTGKPGSRERLDAYRLWNESNFEISPFMET